MVEYKQFPPDITYTSLPEQMNKLKEDVEHFIDAHQCENGEMTLNLSDIKKVDLAGIQCILAIINRFRETQMSLKLISNKKIENYAKMIGCDLNINSKS